MLFYPTVDDYKTAVAAGYIDDCPVTVEDIKIAEVVVFQPQIQYFQISQKKESMKTSAIGRGR